MIDSDGVLRGQHQIGHAIACQLAWLWMTQKKMPHLLEQMAPEVQKPKPPNRVDLLSHGFTLPLRPRNASTTFKEDLLPLHGV